MPRKKKTEPQPEEPPSQVFDLICDACQEIIVAEETKPFFAFHTKCTAAITHRLEYLTNENALLRKQLSALLVSKGRRGRIH